MWAFETLKATFSNKDTPHNPPETVSSLTGDEAFKPMSLWGSVSVKPPVILLLSASAFSSRLVFVPSFLSSFPSSPLSLPLPFPFPFLFPFPFPSSISFLSSLYSSYLFSFILFLSPLLSSPFLPIYLPFSFPFFLLLFLLIPTNPSSSLHSLGTLQAHQAHENCPLLAETSLISLFLLLHHLLLQSPWSSVLLGHAEESLWGSSLHHVLPQGCTLSGSSRT